MPFFLSFPYFDPEKQVFSTQDKIFLGNGCFALKTGGWYAE